MRRQLGGHSESCLAIPLFEDICMGIAATAAGARASILFHGWADWDCPRLAFVAAKGRAGRQVAIIMIVLQPEPNR